MITTPPTSENPKSNGTITFLPTADGLAMVNQKRRLLSPKTLLLFGQHDAGIVVHRDACALRASMLESGEIASAKAEPVPGAPSFGVVLSVLTTADKLWGPEVHLRLRDLAKKTGLSPRTLRRIGRWLDKLCITTVRRACVRGVRETADGLKKMWLQGHNVVSLTLKGRALLGLLEAVKEKAKEVAHKVGQALGVTKRAPKTRTTTHPARAKQEHAPRKSPEPLPSEAERGRVLAAIQDYCRRPPG